MTFKFKFKAQKASFGIAVSKKDALLHYSVFSHTVSPVAQL